MVKFQFPINKIEDKNFSKYRLQHCYLTRIHIYNSVLYKCVYCIYSRIFIYLNNETKISHSFLISL